MTNFLKQYIDPYMGEARGWAERYHRDGTAYFERVIAHLDAIVDAVYHDEWEPGRVKVNAQLADVSQVWDLGANGTPLEVPMGTEWIMDVFSPIMIAGSATVVLRVNGKFRTGANATTGGTSTNGALTAQGLHLAGGDVVTLETIGMIAAEVMEVYLQFRARKIKSPRAKAAGDIYMAADRPPDVETIGRKAPEGVTQGAPVRGDATVRAPNVPPLLPFTKR